MGLYKTGYKRSPPGVAVDRDAKRHLGSGIVPQTSDLTNLTTVVDQGQLGSCIANATANALRGCQISKGAVNPVLPSRLAIYWMLRALDNATQIDAGGFIHLAFQALNTFGYCPEDLWPYTDQGTAWKTMPPLSAFEGSFDQRTPTNYQRIMSTGGDRIDDVKRALGSGHLVVFGTTITDDFASGNLGPTGILQPPGPGDQIDGGHCMLWCGHTPASIKTVNSWGTGVFDGGYFQMSWDYVEYSDTDDIWIVTDTPLFKAA